MDATNPPLPPAGVWSEHVAPDSRLYYYNRATGESTWDRPAELGPAPGEFTHHAAPFGYAAATYVTPSHAPAAMTPAFQSPHGGSALYHHAPFIGPGPPIQKTKNSQGPPGCNLFIFHIPNDMTNTDLYALFAPFGNVISARIMVDRETGRSRGFGFVSFDTPEASKQAIASMDGKPIGRKRLKVALKREKGMGGPDGGSWEDVKDGSPSSGGVPAGSGGVLADVTGKGSE